MPVAGAGAGFAGALADYLQGERERNRKTEDDQLSYQMELIKSLAARPDINERPEIMGQAIHDMMDLANAKGGKGKLKGGAAGVMGAHELPVSQFLKGLVNGTRPMVGDTTAVSPEQVEQPSMSLGQAMNFMPHGQQETPIPSMAPMGSLSTPVGVKTPGAPTGGESVLESPIAMPPQGVEGPATMARMVEAGRGVLAEKGTTTSPPSLARTPVPSARQPYFRSSEEMAREKGENTATTYTAAQESEIAFRREQAKQMPDLTPQERRDYILLNKLPTTTNTNTFQTDKNPDQYDIPGIPGPVDGYSQVNAKDGSLRVVDMNGVPLPPGAVRRVKPLTPPGSIDQQEVDALIADEELKLGHKLTAQEKASVIDKFQTKDANRKAVRPPNITIHNPVGLTPNQVVQTTLKLQQDWNKESKSYSTMINQYNLMQEGLKQAAKGNMNAGSQAVLVTFQKILDPNSVVRESEYARSPEGVSLISRIQGAVQRLSQGGAGVPLKDLQGFARMASQFITGLKGSLDATRGQIDAAAKVAGIDPNTIYGNDTGLPAVNTNQKTATRAQVQQYATEHKIDFFTATQAFTAKGYSLTE